MFQFEGRGMASMTSCLPKIHILKPLVSRDVTVFVDRVFREVIKVK